MNLFCLSSNFGIRSLIDYHFWKYEFKMETFEFYSTFTKNAHVMLALNTASNLICIYSSLNEYTLQSNSNVLVVPKQSFGNGVFSLAAYIIDIDESKFEDEDTIYNCYDSMSLVCEPSHQLFFNQRILFNYDWSSLILDSDFKLLYLDVKTYKEQIYLVNNSSYEQLLCKLGIDVPCKHQGKRITNITGGYKQLNFDLKSDTSFVCPCSIFSYLNKEFTHRNFNYVLFSYKVSQLLLNF